MKTRAVVVVPCHFKDRESPCSTTVSRLNAALCELRRYPKNQQIVVLTGDVPYEPGSKTLARLMCAFLRERGFRGAMLKAAGETGSFLEPQLVTRMLRERFPTVTHLNVVSSDWQLWVGKLFWKRAATERGLTVEFVAIEGTGGRRTHVIYALYAAMVRCTRLLGLWPVLERFLTEKVYRRRYTAGFKMNGCG